MLILLTNENKLFLRSKDKIYDLKEREVIDLQKNKALYDNMVYYSLLNNSTGRYYLVLDTPKSNSLTFDDSLS